MHLNTVFCIFFKSLQFEKHLKYFCILRIYCRGILQVLQSFCPTLNTITKICEFTTCSCRENLELEFLFANRTLIKSKLNCIEKKLKKITIILRERCGADTSHIVFTQVRQVKAKEHHQPHFLLSSGLFIGERERKGNEGTGSWDTCGSNRTHETPWLLTSYHLSIANDHVPNW